MKQFHLSSLYHNFKKTHHTLDGRNPAPPGTYKTWQIMGYLLYINWCRISSINSMDAKSVCKVAFFRPRPIVILGDRRFSVGIFLQTEYLAVRSAAWETQVNLGEDGQGSLVVVRYIGVYTIQFYGDCIRPL